MFFRNSVHEIKVTHHIYETSPLPFSKMQTFFYRSGANIESIDADLNLDNKVCLFLR